jgi:arginine metabolism regulation protein II
MQNSRTYLEQSEALIRTCGLPKPRKSQKVSKLHHIFSYLRIIEESTSPMVYEVEDQAKDNHGIGVRPERNGTVSSSRLAWIEDDEPEDLQEDSLFVSIYQLPTTLLSLLAQTSSLCKQLRSPESSTPEFRRRCQIVEDRIFGWKAPPDLSIVDSVSISCDGLEQDFSRASNPSEVPAHLVAAMHSALIVHFQRQVRNTDPRILQHQVNNTVDHLLVYEKLKKELSISSAAPPWPGFIVGCEAYDLPIRRKMETYLKLVRRYSVGNYKTTERVIREVWRRQDLGRMDTHWESVLRDWNMQVVLT